MSFQFLQVDFWFAITQTNRYLIDICHSTNALCVFFIFIIATFLRSCLEYFSHEIGRKKTYYLSAYLVILRGKWLCQDVVLWEAIFANASLTKFLELDDCGNLNSFDVKLKNHVQFISCSHWTEYLSLPYILLLFHDRMSDIIPRKSRPRKRI